MIKGRRTQSVHPDEESALDAGTDLIRLLNGVPPGFKFAITERFGAFILISYPIW